MTKDRSEMRGLLNAKIAQNPSVNACRGKNSSRSESKAGLMRDKVCLCCWRTMSKIRPKQKFCSSRCRLLYWATGEILREYRAGNADGLRKMLKRINP